MVIARNFELPVVREAFVYLLNLAFHLFRFIARTFWCIDFLLNFPQHPPPFLWVVTMEECIREAPRTHPIANKIIVSDLDTQWWIVSSTSLNIIDSFLPTIEWCSNLTMDLFVHEEQSACPSTRWMQVYILMYWNNEENHEAIDFFGGFMQIIGWCKYSLYSDGLSPNVANIYGL